MPVRRAARLGVHVELEIRVPQTSPPEKSGRSAGGWSGDPMASNATHGPAQKSIGNERQQDRDHRRLAREKLSQKHRLIDDVHDDAEYQNPRGRNDPFPQAAAAPLDPTKDRQEIGRAPEP